MAPDPSEPRTVVVGVDLDIDGQAAEVVHAARGLANLHDCRLEILHALELSHVPWRSLDEQEIATARTAILARLGEILDEPAEEGRGLADDLAVVPGPAAQALIERSRSPSTAWMVLGRHRREGVFDFGNTVRAVLARADCPVWIQGRETREVRRILVPVDLSDESRLALGLARDRARATGASVLALHCFVRPDLGTFLGYPIPFPSSMVLSARERELNAFEECCASLDWGEVEWEQEFVDADPAGEILRRQEEFDLIAMGSHGRTGLTGAVLGSVAYAVLREAVLPVVVVRSRERSWLA